MWAKSYERDLRDVLGLQGEIARTIADEVKASVSPDVKARLAKARPVDPRAYEAYLKGQFFFNKITDADLQKATEYAQQAIQIDPSYAQAYGLMALSYWANSHTLMVTLQMQKRQTRRRRLLQKHSPLTIRLPNPMSLWDWSGCITIGIGQVRNENSDEPSS